MLDGTFRHKLEGLREFLFLDRRKAHDCQVDQFVCRVLTRVLSSCKKRARNFER